MSAQSSFTGEIILTDLCSKSNKKINYIRVPDPTEPVRIESSTITSWHFSQNFSSVIKDIFLPKGYPDSVSRDYLEYQIWDTCQAFCSSISGTLTMRAIMEGIGVGSEAATPVSAAITWIIKDGTGMIGSILFAWVKGSKLDSDCKKWRLFADILNDIAMFIELYIPIAVDYSMYMLCIATAFKALVGTAGGSTRAAIITHQAIRGNIADVSAKDGSQEICTNLCAFIFGIILLKNVTEPEQVWTVMCTATLFHIIFNYKAVRCLGINVFNSERFCLCLRTYLPTSCLPTIAQVNQRESVFLGLRTSDESLCGFSIIFGSRLSDAIHSQAITTVQLSTLTNLFQHKNYLILPNSKKKKLYVTFRRNFDDSDVLKAYFHAFLLALTITYLKKSRTLKIITRSRKDSPVYRLKNLLQEYIIFNTNIEEEEQKNTMILQAYMCCEDFIEKEFSAFYKACADEGWNVSKHLINIDDWRADWKFSELKKDDPLRHVKRLSYVKPPSPRPPKQGEKRKSTDWSALVIS